MDMLKGEITMKRITGLLLVLITVFSVNVSATKAGYFPTHTETNVTTTQKTKRVNVVVNNEETMVQEIVYGFLAASAIAEDTDFYLYTFKGSLEPIKIEHNGECIDLIMKNYTKTDTLERETAAYYTALNDLAADTGYEQKELVVVFGNGEYNTVFDEFINVKSWFPDIPATVYSRYSYQSRWEKSGLVVSSQFASDDIYNRYIKMYGYSEIPGSYYYYDKKAGTVTIDQGRADANILIYAKAQKADLLYISGYMAPSAIYEENKAKKTVKGVSLGYNFINIEKNASPKNVAWGLFSIDEELYDVNETSFIIPVRNAEYVTLYYKSEMGRGVCTASSKYQRSQDDEIKNLNAPQEVVSESKETETLSSLINKNTTKPFSASTSTEKKESDNKFWEIVKGIFGVIGSILLIILSIAWAVLRLGLFVLVILMIVNKNVRKNITSRVMNSKAGPVIEKIIFKLRTLWANITKTDPPIQGAEKDDKNFVFISHSSKDRMIPNNRIETVVKELEKRNIKCWISNKNIKAGQNYSGVLAKAIENCSIFMVFLSDASAQSKEVGREMTLATSNGKEIIPVQIEDVDVMGKYSEWKYWLSTSQIKFLFNNDKQGINELADEVEGIYKRYVPDYNLNVVRTSTTVKKSTSEVKEVPRKKETVAVKSNENK